MTSLKKSITEPSERFNIIQDLYMVAFQFVEVYLL